MSKAQSIKTGSMKTFSTRVDVFRTGMYAEHRPWSCFQSKTDLKVFETTIKTRLDIYFDKSLFWIDSFGMNTWRGLNHRTLRANLPVRLTSTFHKPANIASLLKSSAESTAESSPEIEVDGYVRTIRKQKRIAFAAVGDGSSLQPVQAVLTPEQALSYVETIYSDN